MKFFKYAVISLFAFSSAAWAQDEPKVKAKAKTKAPASAEVEVATGSLPPYGMAGCGLGSLAIQENTILPQLGATLLNHLISPQTSAITSGTSNCTDKPRETASLEQEVFIAANLNSISKAAAQGSGEHLDALGEVFGCSIEGTEALKEMCQTKFDAIFSNSDSQVVLGNLREEIKSNPATAENCDRA
ncbi:MAG: DUF3015 domain-containing protein [Proteobacteria bacterium]|nr:DUF3015 domain-containing protein [Pseudomonadota bacterium]